VGAAIYVLLPHKLVFAFRGQAVLAASDQEGIDDVTGAYRTAGIWIEPCWSRTATGSAIFQTGSASAACF